jgi:hypothetical protein
MRLACLAFSMLVMASVGSTTGVAAQEKPDMLQVHLDHVMNSFKDTPKQMGLLPTALAEANTAIQHAAMAAKATDNLDQMKLHAGHVIHAVDPSVEMKGPGLGYGVKKAAAGVAQHVELAARAPSATANQKTQALYVARWATNVVTWADDVISVGQEIQKATTASAAAAAVTELKELTAQLTTGVPAVGRFDAQGGLQQAQERMEEMKKGEER